MRMSSVSSQPRRRRLPNRRPSVTEALEVGGQVVMATVGFDPEDDSPRELFLKAGKEGSLLNALLDDAAVVISIALQCGVSAETLARSVGRLPATPLTPAELDHAQGRKVPASPIGAALDLITAFENEAGK